jgi:hypothetical protein
MSDATPAATQVEEVEKEVTDRSALVPPPGFGPVPKTKGPPPSVEKEE